ncbi:AraC family transcriptional regulator [Nocardia goodfellowii]|uniref:AraC-like DNA-binding protein n=1 Tax=Nocardia goodfellowii TaxID=882446 RepID=A0ABS4Q8V0_9NOCA|nr:helix-turn-helix domain-containing protein [Nocardia goodfellowii]MBP2188118.1 AraC-like DNA-binding protein [Nocardia goodfellowii]
MSTLLAPEIGPAPARPNGVAELVDAGVPRGGVLTTDLIDSTVRAPESLRPWISEAGHIPPVTAVSTPFTHVPHTATTIVLRTERSGHRNALVLGPQTRASYSVNEQPAGCLRLRLAPGATRQLLGVPAVDLADKVFRLADLPGVAADLVPELFELAPAEALAFLSAALPQRISEDATQRAHRALLSSAVASLAAATTPVHALASDLAVSERQLRNLFTTGVGVSPKHFARIGRVRSVLAHAGNTPWAQIASLAQVAAVSGYYDQSHMTADFRSLMGTTPASYFKGKLPAPTACRPTNRVAR